MIRYALNCDKGHAFESWFQNSGAYDKQRKRALVACPVCGSTKVEKAIMAPRLAHADTAAPELPVPQVGQQILPASQVLPGPPVAVPGTAAPPAPALPPSQAASLAMMSAPERELRKKLKEIRDHITKNASYVGPRFPEEARKIHYGETEQRSIYGEASPAEAKELHDEGIEFHSIPILPEDRN